MPKHPLPIIPISLAFLLPAVSSAASYTLMAPLGPLSGPVTLSQYLDGIFKLTIGIAGVLAVVMLVICGIKVISSGSVSGKTAAKECLWNALFGMLIAIGAYALLNTINPLLLSNAITVAEAPSGTAGAGAGAVVEPLPTAPGAYFRYQDAAGNKRYSKGAGISMIQCDQIRKGQDTAAPGSVIAPPPPYPGVPECFQVTAAPPSPTEATARNFLCGNNSCVNAKPYGVNNPPCKTPGGVQGEHCTNLAGIPTSALTFIKSLPYASGGSVTITGGTEYNLHKSHYPNKPIFDLHLSIGDPLYNLITAQPKSKNSSFCGNAKYVYNSYVFTDEISACGYSNTRHWHVCALGTMAGPACTP